MQKEQPYVAVYLLAVEGDNFNTDERSLLFFLGNAVWQVMRDENASLPMVTDKDLEKIEEETFSKIEELEGKPLRAFEENALSFIDSYRQINLFKFIMDALMGELKEGEDIREENIWLIALYLKVVIDCFDR